MIDPLHQFEVHKLIPMTWMGYDISFTNSSLFMVLTTLVIIGFLTIASRSLQLVPGRSQFIGESVHRFLDTMIIDQVGPEGRRYLPYVLSLFLFVLIGNFLGMIPYSFTFTSQIIVTFSLAMIVFVSVTILGFIRHGFHFLRLFFPEGTALWLAPILIPIEVMSYFIRPVSLSIRLFANMVAGHAMLKIFAGFVLLLGSTSFLPLSVLPFAVSIAITGFEFLVALLQAYVFTILTCIYLNDAVNLH